MQGSSSARREGCETRQRCILQTTQANNNNNNLQRNRIDTVESVDNVLLLGNIFLHLGAPHRREDGVCHAIPTTGTHQFHYLFIV
jgi:hypothetical protein